MKIDPSIAVLKADNDSLRAEVERLRAALQKIAKKHTRFENGDAHIWDKDCDACNRQSIALEALRQADQPAGGG